MKTFTNAIILLQGYLSFWNDNISYTLRGCILIELALRKRIIVSRDTSALHRPRGAYVVPVQDRLVEVIDGKMTGEVLLDEALKLMKSSERMSTAQWVDLLSGAFRCACSLTTGADCLACYPQVKRGM